MKRLLLILAFGCCAVAAPAEPSADEYLEINADIDIDGIADRLVSEPIRNFGAAGGYWQVFLGKKEGGFAAVGEIYAHPREVRTEKLFDCVRLWVYLKDSGSSGVLGFYLLKDGKIGELTSIKISPGDGGTDLGRAIYATVFPAEMRFTATKKRPNPER